jgi:hypothetical protein
LTRTGVPDATRWRAGVVRVRPLPAPAVVVAAAGKAAAMGAVNAVAPDGAVVAVRRAPPLVPGTEIELARRRAVRGAGAVVVAGVAGALAVVVVVAAALRSWPGGVADAELRFWPGGVAGAWPLP